jgi:hypothetical protein
VVAEKQKNIITMNGYHSLVGGIEILLNFNWCRKMDIKRKVNYQKDDGLEDEHSK